MRSHRARTAALVALLLVLCLPAAVGQDHVAQPYQTDEFAAWMHDMWRAEAVFVGVFPLSIFVTLEAYDIFRYAATGLNPSYAPWPFGSGTAVPYSATETAWLGVSAVSLSLIVAGIDFILGHINASAPQN
jgi:hypothetical protein